MEHYELFDQKHGSARFTSFCTCGAKRTEIDIHWLSREWLFHGLFDAVLCITVYSFQNISTAASIQNIVVLTHVVACSWLMDRKIKKMMVLFKQNKTALFRESKVTQGSNFVLIGAKWSTRAL